MFVKVLVPFVVIGGVMLCFAALVGVVMSSPKPKSAAPPVIINLGQTSSSGSTWQAKELLAAISKNTSASKVTITATDLGGQYVEFSADFNRDELIRTHPGRTPEIWKGQILSRLRNAADGGSLNSPQ